MENGKRQRWVVNIITRHTYSEHSRAGRTTHHQLNGCHFFAEYFTLTCGNIMFKNYETIYIYMKSGLVVDTAIVSIVGCYLLYSCHVHWPTKTGQAIHPSSQPPNMWIDPTRMFGSGDSIWPILKGKERIVASVQKFWRASLRKHEFLAPWLAIFWDATAWHGSLHSSLQSMASNQCTSVRKIHCKYLGLKWTWGINPPVILASVHAQTLEISGQVNKHTLTLSDVFYTWSNVAPALSNNGC